MIVKKQKSKTQATPAASAEQRQRPGRRSATEKKAAVLKVLSGKATVEQEATRLCVHRETLQAWVDEGLAALDAAFRTASGPSDEELELKKKNQMLERLVTKYVMQKELLENALETERAEKKRGPTVPGKSSR
jgi:transposase-like protein